MAKNAMTVWDKQLAEMAGRTAAAEKVTGGNWISIRGGQMSIGGNNVRGNKLEAIVMSHMIEQKFFTGKFSPDTPESPTCYAFSTPAKDNEDADTMAPRPASTEVQADACSDCPHNVWGTADTGKGKACREVRRLALFDADLLKDPKKIGKAEPVYLSVPTTSVKGWSSYVHNLTEANKRPPFAVITEIEVSPDAKTQLKVSFNFVRNITDGNVLKALLDRKKVLDNEIMFDYPKNEPRAPQRGRVAAKPAKAKKYARR